MPIVKLNSGSKYLELFNYLESIEETEMPDIGTFLVMCEMGRIYSVVQNDVIVGGLCMYETKDMVFVPFMHIDKDFRKSKYCFELYKKILEYGKDKKKNIYTTMDDISQVKNTLIPDGWIDGDIRYRIENRI